VRRFRSIAAASGWKSLWPFCGCGDPPPLILCSGTSRQIHCQYIVAFAPGSRPQDTLVVYVSAFQTQVQANHLRILFKIQIWTQQGSTVCWCCQFTDHTLSWEGPWNASLRRKVYRRYYVSVQRTSQNLLRARVCYNSWRNVWNMQNFLRFVQEIPFGIPLWVKVKIQFLVTKIQNNGDIFPFTMKEI
jgi:hypothetical protein